MFERYKVETMENAKLMIFIGSLVLFFSLGEGYGDTILGGIKNCLGIPLGIVLLLNGVSGMGKLKTVSGRAKVVSTISSVLGPLGWLLLVTTLIDVVVEGFRVLEYDWIFPVVGLFMIGISYFLGKLREGGTISIDQATGLKTPTADPETLSASASQSAGIAAQAIQKFQQRPVLFAAGCALVIILMTCAISLAAIAFELF